MPETALNRLRQVEPSEGDRFVEHRSTRLLRSGPLAGEILRLRDSGKLLQVFAPSARTASCARLYRRHERDQSHSFGTFAVRQRPSLSCFFPISSPSCWWT